MSSVPNPSAAREPQLRSAVARLSRAASTFLVLPDIDELPLGDVRQQELRLATLRVLALFDDATARATAETMQIADSTLAIRALQALDVAGLSGEARTQVASVVAAVHADLRGRAQDDVTRALLDATPAGPALAALVFDVDPGDLDADAQVSYCQAAQRLESATHARLGAGLVAFAGSSPRHTQYWVDGDEYAIPDVRASELATALTWSGGRARSALQGARVVSNDLDAAAEAAADGSLQPAALTAIAEGALLLTSGLDEAITAARRTLHDDAEAEPEVAQRIWEMSVARDELLQQYDATVSAYARTHTPAETRRKVRDTLARLDPAGLAARRDQARDTGSSVELRPLPDAMAMISAVMPAEHATACYRAIDNAARAAALCEPEAPLGVRRSDALFAFCARPRADAAEVADDGPQSNGVAAHVDLVMTLDAFLGLSETPAECVGAGPVPASAARRLLADAEMVSFRRVLVADRSGQPLDVGVRRYHLTDAERDFIFMRDRTCRHPGCHQPAYRCDADHAVPYEQGGSTSTHNLDES